MPLKKILLSWTVKAYYSIDVSRWSTAAPAPKPTQRPVLKPSQRHAPKPASRPAPKFVLKPEQRPAQRLTQKHDPEKQHKKEQRGRPQKAPRLRRRCHATRSCLPELQSRRGCCYKRSSHPWVVCKKLPASRS
ncbi:Hypothetical predicted protein [Pelobates cultripes]|uniref:Uncharacterized protein n=1 Tax=Pelobates cultripes TaxID=61616 RepID=A0AAD1R7W5_PELCU|nr:Hypothetical predicted protein [Pelobates cultripes]